MFGAQAQANQTKSVQMSVRINFLVGLESFQRVYRIVAPLTIYLALEVTLVG